MLKIIREYNVTVAETIHFYKKVIKNPNKI